MNIFKVKKIKLLKSDEEVNKFLKKGWNLFRVFGEGAYLVVKQSE